MQPTVAIYIGEFQPLLKIQEETIKFCDLSFDETVVVVCGKNKRQSIIHPLSFDSIKRSIENVSKTCNIVHVNDHSDDASWKNEILEEIYSLYDPKHFHFVMVGGDDYKTKKQLSGFYNFQFKFVPYKIGESKAIVRKRIFEEKVEEVSDFVQNELRLLEKENGKDLIEEFQYYENERRLFEDYPFPETLKFSCADAVLECNGFVALVKRDKAPGKGCWSLPGTFIEANETAKECSHRILNEKIAVHVPEKVLRKSVGKTKLFDDPNRTIGVPRTSQAFHYKIDPDLKNGFEKLPKLKKQNAKWFSFAEIKNMKLFDDHNEIIEYFCK